MIIKKVGFGNGIDAYVEERFKNSVNIIYSDDNNKGKTLVFQALMYALGNEPIFPSGFFYKQYYYFVEFEHKGQYEIVRRGDSFAVLKGEDLFLFDSVTEFKYFFDNNICELPVITKEGKEHTVDLFLFYQLFFVGQDKRNPSNLIQKGRYNKDEFVDMLCSLNGYPIINSDEKNDQINKDIKKQKEEISTLKKLAQFFDENPNLAGYVNKSKDFEKHAEITQRLKALNGEINEYKKKRTREINRNTRLEFLLNELNSLNRTLKQGEIICSECGSDVILYSNGDIKFEISNDIVRKQVKSAINLQIEQKKEIIGELSRAINNVQRDLKDFLYEIPEEIRKILLYSDELIQNNELDEKLHTALLKLEELNQEKKKVEDNVGTVKKKRKEMVKAIIYKMNNYYKLVDPKGQLHFNKIFTVNNITFSGSQEQEYYFCRILALSDYFLHEFPIIIDSFRDGELSSRKEEIMIDCYKEAKKQILISATLKEEEYTATKYSDIDGINAIDYSEFQDSKLLQESYNERFAELISRLGVTF